MSAFRAVWRFVLRLARTARLLARDPAVPRPLRWALGVGLLPWPGPIDEIVLAIVLLVLAVFYPRPLRRAWRATSKPSMPTSYPHDVSLALHIWHWFSTDHAIAAATHSRKCGELEASPYPPPTEVEAANGVTFSEACRREHRSYALGSIMSSVAFLETSINELFAAAAEANHSIAPMDDTHRAALAGAGPLLAANRLLDRFQLALVLLRCEPFDDGAQPYQDAALLVRLRNELVHYKPKLRMAGDLASAATAFERALESKRFSLNPFTGQGNPFFPDKCLGHGCTVWAFTSALAFADAFYARIGQPPPHDAVREELLP